MDHSKEESKLAKKKYMRRKTSDLIDKDFKISVKYTQRAQKMEKEKKLGKWHLKNENNHEVIEIMKRSQTEIRDEKIQ